MADVYMPRNEGELAGFVKSANAGGYSLEICGFRSKRDGPGRSRPQPLFPPQSFRASPSMSPKNLSSPPKAGTPLHEVEAALAGKNQELAFEPASYSPGSTVRTRWRPAWAPSLP